MSEKLITVREASQELGVLEKEIIDLANKGIVPSYKIGGEFLRFRREDLVNARGVVKKALNIEDERIGFLEAIYDFFYFNDFYIVAFIIIAALIAAIVFF